MVRKVLPAGLVSCGSPERTVYTYQRQIIANAYCSFVEEHMMIGAQAEDILGYIWPVVGAT